MNSLTTILTVTIRIHSAFAKSRPHERKNDGTIYMTTQTDCTDHIQLCLQPIILCPHAICIHALPVSIQCNFANETIMMWTLIAVIQVTLLLVYINKLIQLGLHKTLNIMLWMHI